MIGWLGFVFAYLYMIFGIGAGFMGYGVMDYGLRVIGGFDGGLGQSRVEGIY